MNIRRIRDVSLIDTVPRLLIAADSIGSIGQKPHDVLQVAPEVCGQYLARVPLMEILCLGGIPFSFVLTVSNEMDPTARALLSGVQEAFRYFALSEQAINGSTEENMPSSMTAAGITVLGEISEHWREPSAAAGDRLFLYGEPLVGQDVLAYPSQLVQPAQLQALRQDPSVGLMIPLGSGGALKEIDQLRQEGYPVDFTDDPILQKSGGPATAILFTAGTDWPEQYLGLPVRCIGKIR